MNLLCDDFGVYFEFVVFFEIDVFEIDGVIDGRNGLVVDSGKFLDIMIERWGLFLFVKEEGVECKGSVFFVLGIELNFFGKFWCKFVIMGLKFEEIIFSGVDLLRGGLDYDEGVYFEIIGDEVKEKLLVGKDYDEFVF